MCNRITTRRGRGARGGAAGFLQYGARFSHRFPANGVIRETTFVSVCVGVCLGVCVCGGGGELSNSTFSFGLLRLVAF